MVGERGVKRSVFYPAPSAAAALERSRFLQPLSILTYFHFQAYLIGSKYPTQTSRAFLPPQCLLISVGKLLLKAPNNSEMGLQRITCNTLNQASLLTVLIAVNVQQDEDTQVCDDGGQSWHLPPRLLSTGTLSCLGGGWRGWLLREMACHLEAMALGGQFTFLRVAFFPP